MAASNPHWQCYLGVIVCRERQQLEHFQQIEDILLTLLESIRAEEPCFLLGYTRNLEASEFTFCTSEDVIFMDIPTVGQW